MKKLLDCLEEFGYSKKEILETPQILYIGYKTMHERLTKYFQITSERPKLCHVIQCKKRFQKTLDDILN